jgi:hypothetical protein
MGEYRLVVKRSQFQAAVGGEYDIGLGIIGYEARASFCPLLFRNGVGDPVAFRYLNKIVRSFRKNENEIERAGFHIFDLDRGSECFTAEFILREALRSLHNDPARLIIDISSMSRTTLAGVLSAILGSKKEGISVTFTYAVAKFEKPPLVYPPLIEFEAVSSAFGGAPRGASKSTALVLGLGYETGRAISAYNRLEAEEAWILVPVGDDKQYNDAVWRANSELLTLSSKINVLEYDIQDPLLLYEKIRTLGVGLRRSHRLVFIPSGPKLCALVTFLVAIELYPEVSVWRMSSGPLEPLFHRAPSGIGTAVTVDFERVPAGSSVLSMPGASSDRSQDMPGNAN